MIKIIALGIISVILALVVSQKAPQFSMCIILVAGVLMIGMILEQLTTLVRSVDILMTNAGIDTEVFTPVVKVCGISILVKIFSDMCKDAGYSAVATKIQFGGSILSMIAIFPLFVRIMNILKEIL